MANEIKVKLSVEGNAKVEIDQATKSVKAFGQTASSAFKGAAGAFQVFAGTFAATAVTAGFRALSNAASSLFNIFITDGVRAAQVQEDAINQLNTALRISGKYSRETSEDLQAFASQLQATSKYGDEAILEVQGLIQNLGQLDKEGLKRATKATVDLSAALGIDLRAAALLVGKAAQGEISSFSRYGLSIKKAATSGETFERVLTAINKQFGGAAAAQVKTFSGANTQLSNTFGDLKESIGFVITSNKTVIAIIQVLGKQIRSMTDSLTKNRDLISSYVSTGIDVLIGAFKALLSALDVTVRGFSFLYNSIRAIMNSVLTVITGSVSAVLGVFAKLASVIPGVGDSFKETFERSISAVKSFANAAMESSSAAMEAFSDTTVFGILRDKIDVLSDAIHRQVDATTRSTAAMTEQQDAIDDLKDKKEEITETVQKEIDANNKLADSIINSSKTEMEKLKEKQKAIFEARKANRINDAKAKKALAILDIKYKTEQKKRDDKEAEETKRRYNERLNAASASLNALATLQNVKSKEIAAVGKAAAIAQTTIDTYRGAEAAAASLAGIPFVGPALAAAAAAAFIAAGLARVAQISGVQLQEGMTEVPGTGTGDTFGPVMLAPHERVVDAGTNADLKSFLSGSGGQTELLSAILERIDNLATPITVNIGGKELVSELLDQQRGGRSLAV